jgi:hypothetical protein
VREKNWIVGFLRFAQPIGRLLVVLLLLLLLVLLLSATSLMASVVGSETI